MLPTVVVLQADVDLHERPPLRPLRLADQMHPRFGRRPVRLLSITAHARTDDIFPRGRTTAIARDDVVEIQVFAIEFPAAILAHIAVALENIVAGELDLFLWHAVKEHQQDDAGNTDAK